MSELTQCKSLELLIKEKQEKLKQIKQNSELLLTSETTQENTIQYLNSNDIKNEPSYKTQYVNQNIAMTVDVSGSMFGENAEKAQKAIYGFSHVLASPIYANLLKVGLVRFADSADILCKLSKPDDILNIFQKPKFSLMEHSLGGGTNIAEGLSKTYSILNSALKNNKEHTGAISFLFSDGGNNSDDPFHIAKKLKSISLLVTVAYAGGNEELLRALATSPDHYYVCKDGKELIRFLYKVAQELSTALVRCENTINILSKIRF